MSSDTSIKIKQAIENSGLTLIELQNKTGISKSAIQRYASGNTDKIPIEALKAIAKATDTSASFLMGWDEEPKPKNIFTRFKTMTHTVPVYGKIPAGVPFEAIQERLGDVAVPDKIARKSDLFGLKIVGDSMNKIIPDGAIGIFQKCCEVNSNDVAVIMVNGDDATVKHFTKTYTSCILEPDSYNPEHQLRIIHENDNIDVKVIGKLVWYCVDLNN